MEGLRGISGCAPSGPTLVAVLQLGVYQPHWLAMTAVDPLLNVGAERFQLFHCLSGHQLRPNCLSDNDRAFFVLVIVVLTLYGLANIFSQQENMQRVCWGRQEAKMSVEALRCLVFGVGCHSANSCDFRRLHRAEHGVLQEA